MFAKNSIVPSCARLSVPRVAQRMHSTTGQLPACACPPGQRLSRPFSLTGIATRCSVQPASAQSPHRPKTASSSTSAASLPQSEGGYQQTGELAAGRPANMLNARAARAAPGRCLRGAASFVTWSSERYAPSPPSTAIHNSFVTMGRNRTAHFCTAPQPAVQKCAVRLLRSEVELKC
eukprot:2913608-Rhodomonas_salina.2